MSRYGADYDPEAVDNDNFFNQIHQSTMDSARKTSSRSKQQQLLDEDDDCVVIDESSFLRKPTTKSRAAPGKRGRPKKGAHDDDDDDVVEVNDVPAKAIAQTTKKRSARTTIASEIIIDDDDIFGDDVTLEDFEKQAAEEVRKLKKTATDNSDITYVFHLLALLYLKFVCCKQCVVRICVVRILQKFAKSNCQSAQGR
jgi:hypothetical protein